MDEHNFQQELHALKQHVSELSLKYPSHSQNMSSSNSISVQDPFFAQLSDVKAHLAAMEGSPWGSMQQVAKPMEAPLTHIHGNGYMSPQQARLTLPSGPVFWQLFNSLRSDVNRISDLEQTVSDLEDRLDRLDPNRFTPPGSTTSYDPNFTQAPNTGFALTRSLHSQHQIASELCTDMGESQGCLPIPADQEWCAPPDFVPQGFCPPLQSPQVLSKMHNLPPPHPDVRDLKSAIEVSGSVISRLDSQNEIMRCQINRFDNDNERLMQAIKDLTKSLNPNIRHGRTAEVELPTRQRPHAMPEGVVFRDREIDRMDEQLRIAHERLRATEETIGQKDFIIEQLRSERDVSDARDHAQKDFLIDQLRSERNDSDAREQAEHSQKKEQLIQYYRQKLANKDMEVYDLQDQIAEKDNALRDWEESWNQIQDSNYRAAAKAAAYENALKEHAARKDEAMDQLTANHEEEMAKVKEFCEQKDAVIQKQEEVISRGGGLLEQREEEIESLQRKLRVAEDDVVDAKRTGGRIARLLYERDAELAELKDQPKHADPEHPKRSRSDSEDPFGRTDRSVANEVHDASHPVPSRLRYLPQPPAARDIPRSAPLGSHPPPPATPADAAEFAGSEPWVQVAEAALQFHRRPHGERREDTLELGSNAHRQMQDWKDYNEAHSPSNDRRRRSRNVGRHRRHPYRHYPELAKQPADSPNTNDNRVAWASEPPREHVGAAPSEQRRQAYDDTAYWQPPLPAPVTARRMASAVDLRSTAHNNQAYMRRGLAKHQSLQELPKRRLQAYVETEGESGEERGREV